METYLTGEEMLIIELGNDAGPFHLEMLQINTVIYKDTDIIPIVRYLRFN